MSTPIKPHDRTAGITVEPRPRFDNIQALRFFAALAVVVYHLRAFYEKTGGDLNLKPFVGLGFAGVDVFFVISGFIIWTTTRTASGPPAAASFARRRAVRIYSLWAVVCTAAIAETWLLQGADKLARKDLLLSYLLVPQSQKTNVAPINWTLSYELFFYALMTLAIAMGGRRRLWVPLLGVGALAVLTRLKLLAFHQQDFVASPLVLEFAAGCLVAAFAERRRIPAPWLWVAAACLWLAAVALWMHWSGFQLASGRSRDLRVALLLPPAAALVAGFAGLEGRFRFPRPLIALGNASYGLYLWHLLLFDVLRRLIVPVDLPPVAGEALWAAMLLFACLFSLFSYRAVEQPLLAALKAFPSHRLRQPRPA